MAHIGGQRPPLSATRMVIAVSTVVALCIMGDSLMYSILPLHAASIGIALPLVGVLLSVNRFIRLLSNRWAGSAFERFGSRGPFAASTVVGLLSTFAYGPAGFPLFLIARSVWGISWSGLRQGSYVATWSGAPDIRGRLTGLVLGIVRLGSAVGVVLGGILYDRFGFGVAVTLVGLVGLLAIPISVALPWDDRQREASHVAPASGARGARAGWRQFAEIAFQNPAHRWLSLSSFFVYLLGGIIVSTTSIFVASRLAGGSEALALGLGVATLTGLLHGTRWVTSLLVGPIVGALSDRFGKDNTLLALGLLMMAALLAVSTLAGSAALLALLIVLLLDGSLHVVVNATATTVATDTARPHAFVAAFSTMSDAGSAFGPLIAFSALATARLPMVYLTASSVVVVCLYNYWRAD